MSMAIARVTRSGRILAAVEVALALGAVLAAIAVGVGMHVSARQSAERELRRLAVVLGEQTSRALQAIDLVLADVAADTDISASNDATHFRAVVATPAMHRALRARIAGLPQADAILVIGADGTMLLSSRGWPAPAISVADRAYFQAVRDGTWRRPFLSEPVSNRETGSWVFNIVHRVSSANGAFLGVLLGSIDLDYISGFHAAIGLPPGMGVALVRQDGVVLTHFPADMARDPGSALSGLHATEAGVVYDQPLANFPAAIEVSISHAAMFADWRRQAAWLTAGTACGLLCILLLLRGLLRQFHRLEAAQAAVQEKSLLFETTLANMDEGLMMVTAGNEVAVCNDRAIELLGLPPDLMRGKPSFDAGTELAMAGRRIRPGRRVDEGDAGARRLPGAAAHL